MQNIADYIRETDKVLLLLCVVASLYGSALIYSATNMHGSEQLLVQLGALVLGLGVAIFISLFDYSYLTKFWPIYIVIGIVLLLVTYQFGITPAGSDNKAWLSIFGISFQVSELIKIFMILTFAKHVSSIDPEDINNFGNIVLLTIHGLCAPAIVMILQKDLGTVTVMIVIFLSMMYMAGVRLRYFLIGLSGVAVAAPFAWIFVLSEYQKERFKVILDLEADAKGYGYQQLQSIKAIGSGGVFGQGYMNGAKTQTGGVPESHNDFILTVAGEELGLIGCLAVFVCLVLIIIRVIYISTVSKDITGKIICAGAFGMLAAQLIINTGMVMALLPVIGVTLPFFSAGGSSLVCLFISVGLVLSVYKNRFLRTIYLRDKG